MLFRTKPVGWISALAAAAFSAVLLAGCSEEPGGGELTDRAYQPLSPEMLALMQEKGTTQEAPILIRSYKKEAEFEIWKMRSDGQYVLLKTYPMCRWSGQLGPKTREGDMQVPEGFYSITPGQMNPRSNYYLSFNVGYPNTYDRAHGRTGGNIMVHGICSSAGCFSMTDQQIGEIYALAREAFAGGQRAIQMQSMPFHMTAENFAKYRLDPNIGFWKELKVGTDNFEVTHQEVKVGVCNLHYVFNADPANGSSFDPTGPCPPLKRDELVQSEVAAKELHDDAKVAELVAQGVPAIHTVYADGGQNAHFATWHGDVSDPDALAKGSQDLAIEEKRHLTPAQLKAAEAKDLAKAEAAEKKAAALRAKRGEPADETPVAYAEPAAQQTQPQPQQADGSIFTRLFSPQARQAPAQAAAQPVATQPAAAQAAEPPADTQGNGSILTRLFTPQGQKAPAQAAEQTPQPAGSGFNQLYSETQPTPQSAATAPAQATGAAEAVGGPVPPLRGEREDSTASINSSNPSNQSTTIDGATATLPDNFNPGR
ncbi:MAG TPA: murein L,D-transpeptidase family protein [Methylovirgula sp.]|nr:murein L,D-transpeptidase family protein [Methylovirgula sp.]